MLCAIFAYYKHQRSLLIKVWQRRVAGTKETDDGSKFANKVVVVTGGTSGIGLATAKAFSEEGAFVFVTGRRQETLDAAVKEIESFSLYGGSRRRPRATGCRPGCRNHFTVPSSERLAGLIPGSVVRVGKPRERVSMYSVQPRSNSS